ncbi:hypothetical protein [Methylovulum miyakonense]|uniref:hypothetical protein n=1 Tax=Methylovulum miyakonense TaxID=645578 RepID=UPI000686F37A|nr:hypothetical protein [Methylovulum miyakonense]
MLDGKPIFMVLTGTEQPSRNSKTGPMLQTWILRSDVNPLDAMRFNEDVSICGNCPLRGSEGKGRSCYVTVARAPYQIYKSKPNLKKIKKHIFKNRAVRLGAYGDPAAIPTEVIADIRKRAIMTTGYTHQWRTCDQDLKQFMMASCDSEQDREEAKALGWATLRVKKADDSKLPGEVTCPASEEAGKKMTCYNCGLCRGGDTSDVVINVHGVGFRNFGRVYG